MVERVVAKAMDPYVVSTRPQATRHRPIERTTPKRVDARLVPCTVHVVSAFDRVDAIKQMMDRAAEGRQRPVLVLFNDAAERYDPELCPDVQFIDAAGGMSTAANVQTVSNPAFLEMIHARILKTIQAGARHIIIDDASMLRFYNGEGPTHAFFHSLSAAMMLRDVTCDIVVPENTDSASFAKALETWTG